MGLFSFLTKPNQPDLFEKELLQLELRITAHQNNLQTIHQRLGNTLTTISLYVSSLWLLYSLLWYSRDKLLPSNAIPPAIQSLLVLPVLLIPFLLLSFRWIFQYYYRRKEEAEQIQLRLLKKQLRDKVEEVKKKTAYYSTKELLERYDDQAKQQSPHLTPNQPGRTGYPPRAGPTTEAILRERNRVSSTSTVISNNPAESPNGSQFSPAQNPQLPVPSPTSQPQPQKPDLPPSSSTTRGWADRVAEALLGNDEAGPQSKYALICKNCYAHNGLVRREELDVIRYICPNCRVFNPSRKREGSEAANGQRTIGKTDELPGSEGNNPMKSGTMNKKGKSQQSEPEIGLRARKSLGGLVKRSKSSSDSFHVIDKKRAVSYANPGASISTSDPTDYSPTSDHDHSDTSLEPSTTDDHNNGLENHLDHESQNTSPSPTLETPSKPSTSRSKS